MALDNGLVALMAGLAGFRQPVSGHPHGTITVVAQPSSDRALPSNAHVSEQAPRRQDCQLRGGSTRRYVAQIIRGIRSSV